MDSSELIKELNGEKPFAALKLFLQDIESSEDPNDLILDVLKVSPRYDDILKLLKIPKLKKTELGVVFDVLGCILMSLAKDENLPSVSIHITRWVLQNCTPVMASLLVLKSPARSLIAVLHCVTGMVLNGPGAANDVLTHLNMTRVKFSALVTKRDGTLRDGEKDVRTQVFCLALAFLNTRDSQCLTLVLQNTDLVPSLLKDLSSDPSEMVVKLLTELHAVVVMNMSVAKSIKVKVFSKANCTLLSKLYFREAKYGAVGTSYSEEEKIEVKAALHKLMVSLCSDLKHGIVFREKVKTNKEANMGFHNNRQVFTILKSINCAWDFEEGRELISKTIAACPDVAKLFKDLVDPYMHQPSPTYSLFSMVKLLVILIEQSEPWKTVEVLLSKKSAKNISIRLPVVTPSMIKILLEKPSIVLRHSAIMLLLVLLKKVKETLGRINNMSKWSDSTKQELKDSFLLGVKGLGGGIQKVINRWNIFLQEKVENQPEWYSKEFPSKFSLLADTTELLCLYSELLGFQAVRSTINPLQMLNKIQNVSQTDIEQDFVSHKKVVKFILQLVSVAQQNGNFEAFGFGRDEANEDEHVTLNDSLFLLLMKVHCACKFSDKTSSAEVETCKSSSEVEGETEASSSEVEGETEKSSSGLEGETEKSSSGLEGETEKSSVVESETDHRSSEVEGEAEKSSSGVQVNADLKDLSLTLLNASLSCWGLSSYCENHIDIWLNKIPQNEQEKCSAFLSKVISKSVGNFFSYLDVLITLDAGTKGEGFKSIDLIGKLDSMDTSLEIKDNETVMSKDMVVPFSCLILGAVEVLKSDPEPQLMQYFSAVLDDYIQNVPNPEVLAKHILMDDNILTLDTRNYLKSWISDEDSATDVRIPDASDILSRLKYIFVTKNIPSSSAFCAELKASITDINDLISICRQVLLYTKVEHRADSTSKSKKKFKLFLIKVLRCVLQIPENESEFEEFHSLFKYLIDHPFLLESYNPLKPTTALDTEIQTILTVVLVNYPDLHSSLKPYMDKTITHLESLTTLDDLNLHQSLSTYISSYNQLTYHNIETITHSLLTLTTFPCPEEHLELLTNVLSLLLQHSTQPQRRARQELTLLLLSKLNSVPQKEASIGDREKALVDLMSRVVSVSMSVEVINKLKLDDFKGVVRSRPLNTRICTSLLATKPSLAPTLAKLLDTKAKMDLRRQAAFVARLLRASKACVVLMHSYLCRAKREVTLWLEGEGEEEEEVNEDYRELVEVMLRNNMFDYSEVVSICTRVYEGILTHKTIPPHHVVSVAPLFHYLSTSTKNNNNGDIDSDTCSLSLQPKVHLLTLCLNAVGRLYKKDRKESDSLLVGESALLIRELVSTTEAVWVRRELYPSKVWASFAKQVLKLSLTDPDRETSLPLLECLTLATTVVYSKKKKKEGALTPLEFYQRLRSHSQFIPLMLGTSGEAADGVKEKMVLLQLALVERCPSVCEERHVPVLLGAYGATKAPVDQAILKLLWLYESQGFMPIYFPSLWGRAAVTHFAVEKGPGVPQGGHRNPKNFQTLSLLDEDKVVEAALNFDMEAALEPSSPLVPTGPSGPDAAWDYDQRFLLLVFRHLTATGGQVSVMQVVEKGAVAVALAALSSHREEVWATGAAILKSVVTQFKSSGYYNLKLQWMWLVGVLGYGLEGRRQRVPSLLVHFLVNASQMLLQPDHQMYGAIMNYIYLKPALPLFKVPELYVLFFSSSVAHHRDFRAFFLQLLVSGVRDNLDYRVCLDSFLPKLVIALINSPTADTKLRILALNVLESIVEVSDGADSLVLDQGLLVELPLALEPSMFCPIRDLSLWIDAVIYLLSALWKTWRTEKFDKYFVDTEFHSSTSTVEMGDERKGKRKLEETFNGDATIGTPTNRRKKRRTSGRTEEESEEMNEERDEEEKGDCISSRRGADFKGGNVKEKSRSVAVLLDLLVCLGRVVPRVVTEGTLDSVSKCFDLVNQILDFSERVNQSNIPRARLINIQFLKQQVKSWIDESVLKRRLRDHYHDEDDVLFSANNSLDHWKHKPLRTKVNKETEEDMEEIERSKRIKHLVQSTKKLFTFLNSTKL